MRLHDWPDRLNAAIKRHRDTPFAWDKSDCMTFPLDCVESMTGNDIRYWGPYDSLLGAYRLMKANGFANIADVFASEFTEISPALMGRGDLAVVEYDGAISGAVCIGKLVAGKTEAGLIFIDHSHVTRAFRVE